MDGGMGPMVVVGLMGLACSAPARVAATCPSGSEPLPRAALERSIWSAAMAGQGRGFGLDDQRVCILGARLDAGEEARFSYGLSAGERFIFAGAAAEGVVDLDLAVTDSSGRTLVRDAAVGASPIIEFAAPSSGTYDVVLSIPAGQQAGIGALAVLRQGAPTFPEDRLAEAVMWLLDAAQVSCDLAGGSAVLRGEGRWMLFGVILDEDETVLLPGFSTGGGAHTFIAAGDSRSSDIDLEVLDEHGAELASDVASDPLSIVEHGAEAGQVLKIRLTNFEAVGPTVVIATVLRHGA